MEGTKGALLGQDRVFHVIHHEALPFIPLPASPPPQLVLTAPGVLAVGANDQQASRLLDLQCTHKVSTALPRSWFSLCQEPWRLMPITNKLSACLTCSGKACLGAAVGPESWQKVLRVIEEYFLLCGGPGSWFW